MKLTPSAPATRRALLAIAVAAVAPRRRPAAAAEGSALWPIDGIFPDCAGGTACISSQDDRPAVWDNPWIAEGALGDDYAALKRVLTSKKLGGRVVAEDGERYLRAEFEASGLTGSAVDDAEFFFTPNDTLVQFKAVRRGGGGDFGANRKRLETARIALGWEKVPVLRNRRRALVIVESPLDQFGPALYSEVYGDTDPAAVPFKPPTKLERAWQRESDDRVRSR